MFNLIKQHMDGELVWIIKFHATYEDAVKRMETEMAADHREGNAGKYKYTIENGD